MNKLNCGLATVMWFFFVAYCVPPPGIPGEDITSSYNTMARIKDTSVFVPPKSSPRSPLWIESAMKSWDAPSLSQQIEEDTTTVPIGKGAIYIPRFSDPALEPTIQINFLDDKLYKWGETGKRYTVLPGEYSVIIGSGSIHQRIVKKVKVEEGETVPLIPDWCGLTVDIVDESNVPFRGPYEIARVDEFEAYGRSYGRDLTLGERLKPWILKPGLYKIFTAGGSYNTMTNFITVRLVPGELVNVIAIEKKADLKILGGGVVTTGESSARRKSNWNHNLNIGGSITFNSTKDKVSSSNTGNVTNISFLTLFDLIYKKGASDWETNIFWNEGLNFTDFVLSDVKYTGDEFRINSLWIWRVFFPWLGPYLRTKLQMEIFPQYETFDKNTVNHYFVVLNPDSSLNEIDSGTLSRRTKPAFSPVTFEAGIGTNIDVVTRDNYEAKVRVGLGYSQTNEWGQVNEQDSSSAIDFDKIPPQDTAKLNNVLKRSHIILQKAKDIITKSYGPEFGLALNLRAGNLGIARGDFKTIIPVEPLIKKGKIKPDYDINSTISWTLTRSITLDYLFQYQLQQAGEDIASINKTTHSIFLRFSFNSR
ncbi:MAG TPA: hypothetical protein DCO75_10240 [Fibrobacteres bacterium]|nr:hypothetical protein [Fibrobacterota bacterium]